MKKVGYKITDRLDLIEGYLNVTKPVHKLTPMEIKVLSYFIDQYLELQSKVLDDTLLNKLVFSKDTRETIMNRLDISKHSLSNTEASLSRKGIFNNGIINKYIIPELDGDNLKLYVYFYK